MKLKKEIDKDILSLETKMIYGISQKNLNIFVEVLKKMIKNLEV